MDFNYLSINGEDNFYTPFASKNKSGWEEGYISIKYLNNVYGGFTSYEDLVNNAVWDGHLLFFEWLKDKGKLPKEILN